METYYEDHRQPAMMIHETTEITVINKTSRTIIVNDDIGTVITQMNLEERNTTRKETRRHISLEASNLTFKSMDNNPEEVFCHKEEMELLHRAIATLNENQKKLIYRVFWLNESQYDIAREEGVSRTAIHNRLKKIFRKLKKFLENGG